MAFLSSLGLYSHMTFAVLYKKRTIIIIYDKLFVRELLRHIPVLQLTRLQKNRLYFTLKR